MTDKQFKYWQDRFDLYFQDAIHMAFMDLFEESDASSFAKINVSGNSR
jgi:hypothetical protein